ncbi:MAG: beta-galactosidase trimerization domain-containing protein [Victivallaceae bacterium]
MQKVNNGSSHLGEKTGNSLSGMSKYFICLACFFVFGLIHATPVDYGPKWISPSGELVTPHIRWRKPDASGPLKILFVTHKKGMREVVELRQRFDTEITVFAAAIFPKRGRKYYPEHPSQTEMEDELLKKLEGQYDIIVLAGIRWNGLPLWARYRILKKVSEGAGLFGAFSGSDKYLERAMNNKSANINFNVLLPYKGLPAFAHYPDIKALLKGTLKTSRFGKGGIFRLQGYKTGLFQPLTPAPSDQLPKYKYYTSNKIISIAPLLAAFRPLEYDYYMAYIGHLLLAVGRKNAKISIGGDDFITRSRTDGRPLTFILKSEERTPVKLKMVLRTAANEVIQETSSAKYLASGKNSIEFKLTKVPAGDYFVDIWALTAGKTLAWGSAFMQVKSAEKIVKAELPLVWEKGKTVNAQFTVANPDGKWNDLKLCLERRDNFGRLNGEWAFDLAASAGKEQKVTCSLAPSEIYSIIQYIDVKLKRGREVLDRKSFVCSVKDFYPDKDLRSVVWGLGGSGSREYSYLAACLSREWRNMGFDSHFTTFNLTLPLANLWHISYATRLIERSKKSSGNSAHIRYPALNDPVYRNRLADILSGAAREAGPYGTREFSLGNECYFAASGKEMCFAPTSKAFFREFLKSEYGNIKKLNEEYGSSYKNFTEVEPVVMKDLAGNRKLIPLWVDFRRAMESQWADITRFGGDTLRSVIPGAQAGYDGDCFMNSLSAADYYKTGRVNQMNSIYERPFTMAALRDFCTDGTLIGMGWDGGYNRMRSREYQRGIAWKRVFSGANILWIFNAIPGAPESVTAADFSCYDFFKIYLKEMKELKSGIGKLLLEAKRSDDGIGIMYSASSVHAATLTKGLPQMEPVINNLCRLLDDSGFQYRAVAYKQVEEGILKKSKLKVLFLPYVQALSPKEGEEIRQFVAAGGILIADLRPGVCDQHGKAFKSGLLDDVFGIRQKTNTLSPKSGTVKIARQGFPNSFPETVSDASLELTSGKAAGRMSGLPDKCLIFNRYGKGQALLLNFSLSDYYKKKDKNPKSAEYVKFMRDMLASCGLRLSVVAEPAKENLKIYRFESGASRYIGILEELPEAVIKYALREAAPLKTETLTLTTAAKGYIYNVRTGKYLGYGNKIKTRIKPFKAQLYGVYQYKLKSLKTELPDTAKPGDIIKYAVTFIPENGQVKGLNVLHMELIAPDGQTLECYRKNLVARNGQATGQFELALDAAAGQWQLTVRDTGTGVCQKKTFTVQAR